MKSRLVFMVLGLTLSFVSYSLADVPHMINYQGKLTAASGGCLNDTVQMTFSIYPDTLGSPADWSETQMEVVVKEGIFNVLLGAVDTIPQAVFDGNVKYLGVQVESDPEMRPLKPMVSVAYAMKAGSGGDCHDCDTVFVNATGPDSVVATEGTAFLGAVYGALNFGIGIRGYAQTTEDQPAFGGYFETSYSGIGDHTGLVARGLGNSSATVVGVHAVANNEGSGTSYAGFFDNYYSEGTGVHYGITAASFGSSSSTVKGMAAIGDNNSSGDVYGGDFSTSASAGHGYGVYAESRSEATSRNYGTYSYANNQTTGDCFAGYFLADDEGTGTDAHIGVRGEAIGTAGATAYGVMGYGENTSTGAARGGHFVAQSSGTGVHYGVFGSEAAGGGGAAVYASGDFAGSGAKYAVVKTGRGHKLLSCMESPEVWFEDFGEGKLVNGKAHIELDVLFLETVTINADHPMKVFVQLEGDCNGVFVTKGTTGFDVDELKSGTSNIVFSYRVVAKRKGYEDERLRETDVGYDDPTLYPELQAEIDKKYQEEKQQQQLQREKRKQEEEQRREEQKKMEEERTRMSIR